MKNLLGENSSLYAAVLSSISNIEPWVAENKTTFFPEYTDHSLAHLNEVLLTADSIISDESWPHLTPQDCASMIISVLLHDCAMQLSEDGFYTLIEGKYPPINSRYIDQEENWSTLWSEFSAEAKRFPEKKLIDLFGDSTPIRDIPKNKLELTGRDKLLIGEFLRRHHARLAHEISLNGIPGSDGKVIKLSNEPDVIFFDLCGFIARSHNLSLRNATDRLENNKRQVHLNTHVPFLMLVLRIADYIQIHSERAPQKLLSIKGLVSPISKGEWKKHHAILEINQAHTDPEALYIDAEPSDAITFESLARLFSDIQRELDMSWSVLGEVYGRYNPLSNLGITIRRIRSSLDDYDSFLAQKKPNYIPKVLKFKTADSEMMELLIVPLYGDNPGIGIRELMQNAIDACIELKDSEIKKQTRTNPDVSEDICVHLYDLGEKGGNLEIIDRGIGMTLDVVENYFLNIGASFRNSDRWKKEHETNGHSNVYRTGRFGIGLLAAYLLGEELTVETRHISQEPAMGLKFSCRKGSSLITVSNIEKDYGTKISIALSSKTVKKLREKPEDWDWFCLESPKVVRKISIEKEKTLSQERLVPNIDSTLEDTWHRLYAPGFDDVTWTYQPISKDRYYYGKSTSLICNGIIITDRLTILGLDISEELRIIDMSCPSLVVFDQDGRLPINLERNDLVNWRIPFIDELAADLSEFLAKNLTLHIKSINTSKRKEILQKILNPNIPGLSAGRHQNASRLMICGDSILPIDYHALKESKVKKIFIDAALMSDGQGSWNSEEFGKICTNYWIIDEINTTKGARSYWIRNFFEIRQEISPLGILPISGKRIFLKKSDIKTVVAPTYVPKTFWNRLITEWENEKWGSYCLGNPPALEVDFELMSKQLETSKSFGFSVIYLNWDNHSSADSETETSPFFKAWKKIQNDELFVKLPMGRIFNQKTDF